MKRSDVKRNPASNHPCQETDLTDGELRAYLLGQTPADEAAHLEERLLEDEEMFATLRAVEDDLLDAFARDRLPAAEREQFRERYGGQTERIAFARALAQRTTSTSGWVTRAS